MARNKRDRYAVILAGREKFHLEIMVYLFPVLNEDVFPSYNTASMIFGTGKNCRGKEQTGMVCVFNRMMGFFGSNFFRDPPRFLVFYYSGNFPE